MRCGGAFILSHSAPNLFLCLYATVQQMRFSLRDDTFPLLTTKVASCLRMPRGASQGLQSIHVCSLRRLLDRLSVSQRVFWRGVAEELFWFIAGSTDSNLLAVCTCRHAC